MDFKDVEDKMRELEEKMKQFKTASVNKLDSMDEMIDNLSLKQLQSPDILNDILHTSTDESVKHEDCLDIPIEKESVVASSISNFSNVPSAGNGEVPLIDDTERLSKINESVEGLAEKSSTYILDTEKNESIENSFSSIINSLFNGDGKNSTLKEKNKSLELELSEKESKSKGSILSVLGPSSQTQAIQNPGINSITESKKSQDEINLKSRITTLSKETNEAQQSNLQINSSADLLSIKMEATTYKSPVISQNILQEIENNCLCQTAPQTATVLAKGSYNSDENFEVHKTNFNNASTNSLSEAIGNKNCLKPVHAADEAPAPGILGKDSSLSLHTNDRYCSIGSLDNPGSIVDMESYDEEEFEKDEVIENIEEGEQNKEKVEDGNYSEEELEFEEEKKFENYSEEEFEEEIGEFENYGEEEFEKEKKEYNNQVFDEKKKEAGGCDIVKLSVGNCRELVENSFGENIRSNKLLGTEKQCDDRPPWKPPNLNGGIYVEPKRKEVLEIPLQVKSRCLSKYPLKASSKSSEPRPPFGSRPKKIEEKSRALGSVTVDPRSLLKNPETSLIVTPRVLKYYYTAPCHGAGFTCISKSVEQQFLPLNEVEYLNNAEVRLNEALSSGVAESELKERLDHLRVLEDVNGTCLTPDHVIALISLSQFWMNQGNSKEALRAAIKAKSTTGSMLKLETNKIIKETAFSQRSLKEEIANDKIASQKKNLKKMLLNIDKNGILSEPTLLAIKLEAVVDKLLGEIVNIRISSVLTK